MIWYNIFSWRFCIWTYTLINYFKGIFIAQIISLLHWQIYIIMNDIQMELSIYNQFENNVFVRYLWTKSHNGIFMLNVDLGKHTYCIYWNTSLCVGILSYIWEKAKSKGNNMTYNNNLSLKVHAIPHIQPCIYSLPHQCKKAAFRLLRKQH